MKRLDNADMKQNYGFGADEEARRESEKRQRLEHDSRRQDMEDLLSTEGGRRTVWRWLNAVLGIEEDTFSTNAMAMARAAGVRAAALELRRDILDLAPRAYELMREENNGRNAD